MITSFFCPKEIQAVTFQAFFFQVISSKRSMIMEAAFVVCNNGIDRMIFPFPVTWRAMWISIFSECYACWFQAKINFGKFSLQLQCYRCIYGLLMHMSFSFVCFFFQLTRFLFCTSITCSNNRLERACITNTKLGELLFSLFSFPPSFGLQPTSVFWT